jgi:hypothetical protein
MNRISCQAAVAFVLLIDSYYADNREVSTPTALLY